MTEYNRPVLVSGSRSLTDIALVHRVLDRLSPDYLILGDALGVDRVALTWAESNEVPYRLFKADWRQLGKAAGPRRNAEMVRHAVSVGCDCAVMFPRGGPGTENCRRQAEDAGIVVEVW